MSHTSTAATMATILGIAGIPLAIIFWWRPRPPRSPTRGNTKREIDVDTSNAIPIYDNGLVTQRTGEHLISVIVRNTSERQHQIMTWRIALPGNKNVFVMSPISWDPKLPCWIKPGESLAFHMPAQDLRNVNATHGITFHEMKPWVEMGDGTKVTSKNPVPLA